MTDPSQAPDKAGVVERLKAAIALTENKSAGWPWVKITVDESKALLAALSPPPVVEEAGQSDRPDDPLCTECGCYRSAHEDDDGELLCPPGGGRFTAAPTPPAGEEEVERAKRAVEAARGIMLRAGAVSNEAAIVELQNAVAALAASPRGLTIPDELRELNEKATKGPWVPFDADGILAIMKGRRPRERRQRWPEIVAWTGFDGADVAKRQRAPNLHLIVGAVNFLRQALSNQEPSR